MPRTNRSLPPLDQDRLSHSLQLAAAAANEKNPALGEVLLGAALALFDDAFRSRRAAIYAGRGRP